MPCEGWHDTSEDWTREYDRLRTPRRTDTAEPQEAKAQADAAEGIGAPGPAPPGAPGPAKVSGETPSDLENELRTAINRHSAENYSNTPDFILANYLIRCLDAWASATKARDSWFKFSPWSHEPVEE
jgi:hypothetical protein